MDEFPDRITTRHLDLDSCGGDQSDGLERANPQDPLLHPSGDVSEVDQTRATGTYEVKFLVDPSCGALIQEWARNHLTSDPHASAAEGFGYAVNSLYLDTPAFDVLHRVEGFRKRKYRLRRYGTENLLWLEMKQKREGRVTKQRTAVFEQDLDRQLFSTQHDSDEVDWFRNRLQHLQLQPVCQVTYQRFACLGTSCHGPIRLTLDRDLYCRAANGWNVPAAPLSTNPLLEYQQILELKFQDVMPDLFRTLIHEFQLRQASYSKYRASVEACIPMSRRVFEPSSERVA